MTGKGGAAVLEVWAGCEHPEVFPVPFNARTQEKRLWLGSVGYFHLVRIFGSYSSCCFKPRVFSSGQLLT